MSLLLMFEGFFANIVTGTDDTLSHLPVAASLLKTRTGRFFFSLGMMISNVCVVILAILFSGFLTKVPYRNWISAALIALLAVMIYLRKKKDHKSRFLEGLPKHTRLPALAGIGFLTVAATSLDDLIVYLAIMMRGLGDQLWVGAGILAAGLVQIFIVFKFSKYLARIRYIREFTLAGLILIAALVGLEII